LRELSKTKSVARLSGDNSAAGISASAGDSSVEKEKKGGISIYYWWGIHHTFGCFFKKMLKNSANTTSGLLEVWSEELEGKSDFSNYHTKLVCIIFPYHL
jgi:exportin-5